MEDRNAEIAQLQARLKELLGTDEVNQSMQAAQGGQIVDAHQINVGGSSVGSALGSGNAVLHNVAIEAGGALVIGPSPSYSVPNPQAVKDALVHYLRSLLERYQYLSLHGLGAGGNQQIRIALRSVFVNLNTDLGTNLEDWLKRSDTIGRVGRTILRGSESLLDEDDHGLEMYGFESFVTARSWSRYLFHIVWQRGKESQPTTLNNLFTSLHDHFQGEFAQRMQYHLERVGALETSNGWILRERLAIALERSLVDYQRALYVVRRHRALVLLGDPGSGKTTVLRYLAMGLALAQLTAGDDGDASVDEELAWPGPLLFPVLVQLRRFAETLTAAPTNSAPLLYHIVQILGGAEKEVLTAHLRDRFRRGEVLLMLDGLDEVAGDDRRHWVARAAELFQADFPESRVVLSSRIYAYRGDVVLRPPFQAATLQPLTHSSQDDFLRRWYRAALMYGGELAESEQETAAAVRARELIEGLDRRPRLREIAANPLLLTMISLLHQHRLRLPQQRAELYDACLALLLEQWEQRHAEGGTAGLAAELGVPRGLGTNAERLALIQPIAYQLQLTGGEEARNSEVRQWLLERFLDLAQDDVTRAKDLIHRFLDFLEGRSGLLIARDIRDRYAFPHKTFQEYLCARELIYRGLPHLRDQVLAHRHAAAWREVILLAVGHLVGSGQPEQAMMLGWALLEKEGLVEAEKDGNPNGIFESTQLQTLLLTGELVEELGGNLGLNGRRLKQEVVGHLARIVTDGQLRPGERVDAALLLGRLGDPRLPMPDQDKYWCPIDAGYFWYGEENTRSHVDVPYSFAIARFPVTNVEYTKFVMDGGYKASHWWTDDGWQFLRDLQDSNLSRIQPDAWDISQLSNPSQPAGWNSQLFNQPSQPVVGVSWYEAGAYAAWLTTRGHESSWLAPDEVIRLPTSMEWERAARHTDGRKYAWGNTRLDSRRAAYATRGQAYVTTFTHGPPPVGCYPLGAAACGALDLLGNVWEWSETDQAAMDLGEKPHRRLESCRGGSYVSEARYLRCSSQRMEPVETRDPELGFRLVRCHTSRG